MALSKTPGEKDLGSRPLGRKATFAALHQAVSQVTKAQLLGVLDRWRSDPAADEQQAVAAAIAHSKLENFTYSM